MNAITKSLIGLVTTGTTIAGAFLANSYLNKNKEEKKVEPETFELSAEDKAAIERRNANRVTALAKVFVEYATTQTAKEDLAEIIHGSRNGHIIFYIREGNTHFEDSGHVSATVSVGCSKTEVHRLASNYPDLKKDEICGIE